MSDAERNAGGRIIAGVVLLSLAYAIVRYHVVGPVPWKDFPLYILNKSLALAAFILVALNFSLGPMARLGVPVPWMGWNIISVSRL